ncbi:MAG: hypothetical protein HY749_16210 [Gammaproteobacteria bacterium]|nr:hypothetical protein [Gammaproteobacteria bacterium]
MHTTQSHIQVFRVHRTDAIQWYEMTWQGPIAEFAAVNGIDEAEMLADLLRPLPETGVAEPYLMGGGAAPEFHIVMVDDSVYGH